ncbi:hypothetical protein BDA99DRAFT_527781 [Phascolomyces articulosus]|uniref:Uncharacterized protein n=1 Tax=Phascolomyces articulosus TaxID=60185 RepID=A0AAD5JXN3_9FUNG|nr:hypothetical protein BDA99DRAFT_527781 [Phascolomyces articulosus]
MYKGGERPRARDVIGILLTPIILIVIPLSSCLNGCLRICGLGCPWCYGSCSYFLFNYWKPIKMCNNYVCRFCCNNHLFFSRQILNHRKEQRMTSNKITNTKNQDINMNHLAISVLPSSSSISIDDDHYSLSSLSNTNNNNIHYPVTEPPNVSITTKQIQ